LENGKSHQRPLLRQKVQKDQQGLVPIYIRITVNGHRLEQSIQCYVPAAQWSAAAGPVKGNNEQARQANLYLDTLTCKVLRLERKMVIDGQILNFSNFRAKWLGISEPSRMLMEIFQEHNDQMAALIKAGKDYSPATLERYNTSRYHTRAFLFPALFIFTGSQLYRGLFHRVLNNW
jgi:Arm DNA-binding domain